MLVFYAGMLVPVEPKHIVHTKDYYCIVRIQLSVCKLANTCVRVIVCAHWCESLRGGTPNVHIYLSICLYKYIYISAAAPALYIDIPVPSTGHPPRHAMVAWVIEGCLSMC